MTEEAAGTGNTGVYKDSTSNANHGDDDVSATGQTGQINGGQEFDGTDDQVNFGSGASLNIRNAITMSAWVDMSSRPTKDDWFNLLGKESFPYHFYLYGRDTNLTTLGAYFELDTGNADLWDVTSIDIDPANGWAHVAVTLDGTDIKFYVNGALDHTENEPGIIDDSTGIDLVFTDDESLWFAGSVDEIRISDTALSADWIEAEVCTAGGVVGGTGPPEYPAVTAAVAEIAPNAVGVRQHGQCVYIRHPAHHRRQRHRPQPGGDHRPGRLRQPFCDRRIGGRIRADRRRKLPDRRGR